jgi:Fe-S oxidoreductase
MSEVACECGFKDKEQPDDARCPVTPLKSDFQPSRILDEAGSGWFPRGVRACIGCELCSPPQGASFSNCADRLLLAGGKREGFIPRAFKGALDSVVTLQISGCKQNRLGWITPELKIAEKGEVGIFVSCAPYYDVLIGEATGFMATSEAHAAVMLLNAIGIEPVVLPDEVCCGGDRLHMGDSEGFVALGLRNRDLFKERGVKTIITTCNDCRFTLGQRYPGRIEGWDFDVMSLADYLVLHGEKLDFMPTKAKVAIQPPDRYSDPVNLEAVKKLLGKIPGLDVVHIEPGQPSTFGSWNQFGAISKSMENILLKAAEKTGSDTLIVQSTRVLVRLHEGRRPGSWEETSIKFTGLYDFLAGRLAVGREFDGA